MRPLYLTTARCAHIAIVAALSLGSASFAQEATVPQLIGQLQSYEPSVRAAAAEALAGIADPRVVKPLLDALKDDDADVRNWAGFGLSRAGAFAVPALVEALAEEDALLRTEALRALISIGREAVPALIAALSSQSDRVRWLSAQALGDIGDPRAVDGLVAALRDSDEQTRKRATMALVKLGAPAVKALVGCLGDERTEVGGKALWALGKIGPPAVPGLLGALRSPEKLAHQRAAWSLVVVGKPALAPLRKLLDDRETAVRDRAKLTLIGVLVELGLPVMNALARDLLSENPLVRSVATEARVRIAARYYKDLIASGRKGSEDLLVEGLAKYGHKAMADNFVGSGNPKLEKAGYDWLVAHKTPVARGDIQGPKWGIRRAPLPESGGGRTAPKKSDEQDTEKPPE